MSIQDLGRYVRVGSTPVNLTRIPMILTHCASRGFRIVNACMGVMRKGAKLKYAKFIIYANDIGSKFAGTKRQELIPGDWAIIPAWAEHQEANDGEEEVVWVIVRGPGGTPVVENLGGWGESKKKE